MGKSTVIVASLAAAHAAATAFAIQYFNSMSWCALFDNKGVLEFSTRDHQPCYGEMRPYGNTHKEMLPEHQRSVRKPGDLHSPFPDGTPIMLTCAFYGGSLSVADHNRVVNLILDPTLSPWRGALLDFEVIRNPEQRIVGVMINNTEVDPTVMVNMFMTLRYLLANNQAQVLLDRLKKFPDADPYTVLASIFFLGKSGWGSEGPSELSIQTQWSYVIAPDMDVKAWFAGTPDPKISDGGTFRLRFAYNRPDLHNTFGRREHVGKLILSKLGVTATPFVLEEKRLPEAFKIIEEIRDTAAA